MQTKRNAKPDPRKRPSPSDRRAPRRQDFKRFLIRFPRDLADWIDDTAATAGLSRDAFMRQMMISARSGFRAAQVEGTDESLLFRRLEERLLSAMERVVDQSVREVLSGTVIAKTTGASVADRLKG